MSTLDTDRDALQEMQDEHTARIRELNDAFRTRTGLIAPWIALGELVITRGVAAHGNDFINRALEEVRAFSEFTESNDPWGEHDFGVFALDGVTLNWKVDCYDEERETASPDASDPAQTRRVLTVMLAEEY
ncbi:hypothetical protein HYPDE_26918 [Hyphomicrobium denitrificans 1NES1]|uniref:DUF3768 domain-containing protein n=1 Tax=Hyphomicrobium denitrificans 1NES1 TaxID=670307 RepID=N0B0T7_9HYPH|nr:DUF3768 domain-containing protein [Hyphomicrobium denitrificans]AGK57064.1 hypothetical protein HYPDE_26918 [Hyphomicrobium denitrificans 1NES1]